MKLVYLEDDQVWHFISSQTVKSLYYKNKPLWAQRLKFAANRSYLADSKYTYLIKSRYGSI